MGANEPDSWHLQDKRNSYWRNWVCIKRSALELSWENVPPFPIVTEFLQLKPEEKEVKVKSSVLHGSASVCRSMDLGRPVGC